MADRKRTPENLIIAPLTPKAVDGQVIVEDPPEAAMTLTAHAAEVSGIRLLDAADKARKKF